MSRKKTNPCIHGVAIVEVKGNKAGCKVYSHSVQYADQLIAKSEDSNIRPATFKPRSVVFCGQEIRILTKTMTILIDKYGVVSTEEVETWGSKSDPRVQQDIIDYGLTGE